MNTNQNCEIQNKISLIFCTEQYNEKMKLKVFKHVEPIKSECLNICCQEILSESCEDQLEFSDLKNIVHNKFNNLYNIKSKFDIEFCVENNKFIYIIKNVLKISRSYITGLYELEFILHDKTLIDLKFEDVINVITNMEYSKYNTK